MVQEPDGLANFFRTLGTLLPLALWIVWWLWAVNWNKLGPALREGAWAPVLLLLLMCAVAWSRIAPSPCTCLGFVTIPNFLWQLGYVLGLGLLALFCGWVQGLYAWAPPEIAVEPPAHSHGDGHGHGHDHHGGH